MRTSLNNQEASTEARWIARRFGGHPYDTPEELRLARAILKFAKELLKAQASDAADQIDQLDYIDDEPSGGPP